MATAQLSVRSARARDLAHELSLAEKRPIHAIVEDALIAYAARSGRAIDFKEFWAKLKVHNVDPEPGEPDLIDLINENRKAYKGIKL